MTRCELRADLPIFMGAEGPKNVALAAEVCDGWMPLWYSPYREEVYADSLKDAPDGISEAERLLRRAVQLMAARRRFAFGAGWSSPVARQAHNLKVAGSNPAPATTSHQPPSGAAFFVRPYGPDQLMLAARPLKASVACRFVS